MIENLHGRNYELAKAEADKVDEQIIEVLQAGHSFRVEAGAGSGKTYSLNKVIEWIQSNKWAEYSRKKQNVICIAIKKKIKQKTNQKRSRCAAGNAFLCSESTAGQR